MTREFRELETQLPYAIQEKLRYYLDFVHDRLFEVAKLEDMEKQVSLVRDEVELIFLLRMLYGYFVIGYRNYAAMLSYFESMEVDGFQIGTTEFSPKSQITLDWRQLATNLEMLVKEDRIEQYVKPSLSTDEVIRRILQSHSMERKRGREQ
jgi:hypothetical protein